MPSTNTDYLSKRRNLTMKNATVKWFNAQKGYGFLTDSETSEDVFCHYSQLQMRMIWLHTNLEWEPVRTVENRQ